MKTVTKVFREIVDRALFPLILFTNIGLLLLAILLSWELENTFTFILLGNILTLFILERVWRFKSKWNPTLKEFFRDMGYFGFNGIIDAGVKLGLGYLAITYSSPTQLMPLWASIILATLIVEYFGYWFHRLGHVNHFLWKIHSIHHVPDKVNLLNNNTANFLNIAIGTTVKLLPLILLGFSKEAVFFAASLTTVHSYVVHVNVNMKAGWLGAIFLSPQHHRFHHSTVIDEAQNFAVLLTFWDRVFGTYIFKNDQTPKEVGVIKPELYPKPNEVIRGFVFPFTCKRIW